MMYPIPSFLVLTTALSVLDEQGYGVINTGFFPLRNVGL